MEASVFTVNETDGEVGGGRFFVHAKMALDEIPLQAGRDREGLF